MPTSEPPSSLPPFPAATGLPHIYVINSDSAFLEMVAELLRDVQAEVSLEQMRPNIEVTLGNLRSAQPDLVILDVVPGRREARMLLDALQASDDLNELPVMLASTSPGLAEQLGDSHANLVRDVLPKPFDLDEFYTRIGQQVARVQVR